MCVCVSVLVVTIYFCLYLLVFVCVREHHISPPCLFLSLSLSIQEFKPIGTGHNRKAQPFIAAANIDDHRQVVSTAYNTPIGLYSSGNIQDALHRQLPGLVHDKHEG